MRASSLICKPPVLIVGSGLSAFTAALSLHRAGIKNSIALPESKFTQHSRSGAFLGGSAVRILDRLGLGPQYRTLGTPMYRIQVEDVHAKQIIGFNLESIGIELWTVAREHLQQLFLESLPAESVYFSTKFRSLHIGKSNVDVKVEQSSDAMGPIVPSRTAHFTTKFIIGADGLNSPVRTFMSQPVMTVSSGVFLWRAVVRNQDLDTFPFHIGKEIWGNNRRFGFVRMNQDEVVWWAVISNSSEVLLRPFTPHLIRLFANFPTFVIDLITSVEGDRDIFRAEMRRTWPDKCPWIDRSSCRIALAGDAARPGNAGNFHTSHMLAIEDSYLLANHLAEQNEKGMLEVGPRLHRYEENREERMVSANQISSLFTRLFLSQSPIRRYFVKKLLELSVQRLALGGMGPTTTSTD